MVRKVLLPRIIFRELGISSKEGSILPLIQEEEYCWGFVCFLVLVCNLLVKGNALWEDMNIDGMLIGIFVDLLIDLF